MSDAIDEFLAAYPPAVRDLAQRTRALVRAALPGSVEHLYPGWRAIGYGSGGMKGQICAIMPTKAGVSLSFNRGAVLPDPHGLFTGTGKLLRHVKLTTPAAVDAPALRELILAAADDMEDQ
jgi:hypothetical protein